MADSIFKQIGSIVSYSISTEVTARQAAIATEVTDRNAAIAAEATARTTAINNEVTARQTAIANEVIARDAAIAAETGTIAASLTAEIAARESAVAGLQADIDAKSSFGTQASSGSNSQTVASTSATTIYSYDYTVYASAKLVIQAKNVVNGQIQVSEAIVTSDGTTAYITEYGIVYSGTTAIANISATKSGNNIQVQTTNPSTNSTVFKIAAILINL